MIVRRRCRGRRRLSVQVRRGVHVAPVRRADGGVVRPGAQPPGAPGRGAAVPVQLPGHHPRHPRWVLPAGRDRRAPPPDPRPRRLPRRVRGAAAGVPRRRRPGGPRRRRVLARPPHRLILRRGPTGDVSSSRRRPIPFMHALVCKRRACARLACARTTSMRSVARQDPVGKWTAS